MEKYTKHKTTIESVYNRALFELSSGNSSSSLARDITKNIDVLVEHSENNKGIIAVFTTLMVHKIVKPKQDIRYHQAQQENGFAGRTIDKEVITPFLKKVNFPSMAESGWLTRSLEQASPYTLDYKGKIRPEEVKVAFLSLINEVEIEGIDPEQVLLYFFKGLIHQRELLNVEIAKPHSLSIARIVQLLEKHFTYRYSCAGASRLPTLAIYSAYQCMMKQVARYNGKILCPLESHNSADSRSGRIGDIDVTDAEGHAFEGVEIKHEIAVTPSLVIDAYEKFKSYNTDRYYLLTTANMDAADWEAINTEIDKISRIHGCQVIVNGVYSTLKYYLRLMNDPAEFIDKYVELFKNDETVKYQHKTAWNELLSSDFVNP